MMSSQSQFLSNVSATDFEFFRYLKPCVGAKSANDYRQAFQTKAMRVDKCADGILDNINLEKFPKVGDFVLWFLRSRHWVLKRELHFAKSLPELKNEDCGLAQAGSVRNCACNTKINLRANGCS